MEIDLNLHSARATAFRSQVCIVGAGIAGLTLAHSLAQQGTDVALLEAGGRALGSPAHDGPALGGPDTPEADLFRHAELAGQPHLGTTEGRFRVLGGSSLRWGGQLLPLPREASEASWPVSPAELSAYTSAAERLLGVDDLPYEMTPFFARSGAAQPSILDGASGLTPSLSKWTPFARRNLADTLGRELAKRPKVSVYLHAQATELVLSADGTRIERVVVRTLSGTEFRFAAAHYVVAAGTVETVRLMLASRRVAHAGVGNASGQVGRGFHDHLTLPVAQVTGPARATLLRHLRPWIFHGTLHSLKLEASADLRHRLDLNPVLAHLTIEEPEGSGVAVLRDLLVARQRGGMGRGGMGSSFAANASRMPSAALEALRVAWSAKLRHRRFVSDRAVVTLRLNAAQDLPSLSTITLGDRMDPFGLPEPRVDWRVTPHETATLRVFAAALREHFGRLDGAGHKLDGLRWVPELFEGEAALPQLDDARHAMGGACMGADPRFSVVDADLTVHGIANLSIASAATFPTGAPALPSLPLMALSLRLAAHVAKLISSS
jgi:choline dehydrogenase-like flavoprotein